MLRLGFTGNFATKFNALRSVRTSVQSQINYRMFSGSRSIKNSFNKYQSSASYTSASTKQKPSMALTFLGILGVSSLYLVAHKPILNDAGFANPPIAIERKNSPNAYYDPNSPTYDGAFNGKLNYRHVAMGSMAGLILGYALSRLSTIIFVVAIISYTINVYLRKQGIVLVNTKSVVKDAVNSVSWDEIVFDQPSFSIPFILSFVTSSTL
ncbi:hypothetical protein CANINC_001595 [Pichia inconspicua]|uniref:Uncharacterized protein n=1 Tax=Pichia inconspicua TaxID=52247 RepID=A0A4T0X3C5_9ASCO|nr:hypothetical protein CANINC_001595 [[Candida] inconspicua]